MLDRQIEFNDLEGLPKFGAWLSRRHRECTRRLGEALDILRACGVSEDVLGKEWEAQITAQVVKQTRTSKVAAAVARPHVRVGQSQSAGDKKVNEILLDLARAEELQAELKETRGRLRRTAHTLPPRDVQVLTDRMDTATHELSNMRMRIKDKSARLGTSDSRRLDSLRGDAYIRARVNARALRANIRQAIIAHKFERERLERAYRHQVMRASQPTLTVGDC